MEMMEGDDDADDNNNFRGREGGGDIEPAEMRSLVDIAQHAYSTHVYTYWLFASHFKRDDDDDGVLLLLACSSSIINGGCSVYMGRASAGVEICLCTNSQKYGIHVYMKYICCIFTNACRMPRSLHTTERALCCCCGFCLSGRTNYIFSRVDCTLCVRPPPPFPLAIVVAALYLCFRSYRA